MWRPFLDWVGGAPRRLQRRSAPLKIVARAGAAVLGRRRSSGACPASCSPTTGPGAPEGNVFWAGDRGRRGRCCTATSRRGCPPRCLRTGPAGRARRRAVRGHAATGASSLHVNKGLAGAPAEAIAAARDTAMNPAVLDAFALVDQRAPTGRRPIPASPATSPTSALARAGARTRSSGAMARAARRSCRTPAPTCRRATTSSRTGSAPSGARTTPRLLAREADSTTPTGCSSSTTASAASAGARTGSRARPEPSRRRSLTCMAGSS